MPKKRARGRGVFSGTSAVDAITEKQAREAPDSQAAAGEEHLRITVYLTVDQLDHLDRDRILIRRATRRVLERTALIRGLLEGYRKSGLDLAALGIATEGALAELIAERLGRQDS